MQKINFLPQVKAWNGLEFGERAPWSLTGNDASGHFMTYSVSEGTYKVSVPVKDGSGNIVSYEWQSILTGGSSGCLSRITVYDGNGNSGIVLTGDSSIQTMGTAYNPFATKPNRLVTEQDMASYVGDHTVQDVQMDDLTVVTSHTAKLYSDPSSEYNDTSNFLATLGTVKKALDSLGHYMELRQVYTQSMHQAEGQQVTELKPIPASITTFEDWLDYCADYEPNSADYPKPQNFYLQDPFPKKGDVVIWNNEEYVYVNESSTETPSGFEDWEMFGTLGDFDAVVTSFGGATGAIDIDPSSFYMNSSTLKLHVASDTSLGGVMTGFVDTSHGVTEGSGQSEHLQVYYDYALDVSVDNTGFTSIPLQTGHVPAGLMSQSTYEQVMGTIYGPVVLTETALIDQISLGLTDVQYQAVNKVRIYHSLNSAAIQVSVYANQAAPRNQDGSVLVVDGVQKSQVFVDEVIVDSSTVTLDFGSVQAFIGCQTPIEASAGGTLLKYAGYTVVLSGSSRASTSQIIADASVSNVTNPI